MDAKQFLAEFGHIANAPGGVPRLREMIYNLAITGDLSRREVEDGDSQSLLAQIERAKAKRIREKKYKRSPKLENQPIIVPRHIKIPNTWRWTRLVDIGEINPKNEVEDETIASFIPMGGIPQFHSGKLEVNQRAWGEIKKGFTHFANGDVVLAKISPCFENGKAAVISGLINGVGAGTTELHVVRPIISFIDPAYVYLFLRSPYFAVEGENSMTGTAGQKRLSTDYFATRAFPLPPLAEQKRIVAKVDELMALCDKLEAQQQKRRELQTLARTAALDALANAQSPHELKVAWQRVQGHLPLLMGGPEDVGPFRNIIQHITCRGLLTDTRFEREPVGDDEMPFAIPECWHWTTLGDLADYITSGSRGWKKYLSDKGDIFIRSQDIKTDQLVLNDPAFLELPERAEGKRTLVQENDILLTITGANVGKCALVPPMNKNAYVSQHIALIRLKDSRNSSYLHMWLTNSFGGRQYLLAETYGDKPGLNLRQVGSVKIPLPPLDIQEQIVAFLSKQASMCKTLEKQLTKAQRTAEKLAEAAVAAITGTQIKDNDIMKAPKTELVTRLKLVVSPNSRDQAPLSAILARHKGELSAKALWSYSGLEIDGFYRQLKTEMARGWIVEPEKARVVEKSSAPETAEVV